MMAQLVDDPSTGEVLGWGLVEWSHTHPSADVAIDERIFPTREEAMLALDKLAGDDPTLFIGHPDDDPGDEDEEPLYVYEVNPFDGNPHAWEQYILGVYEPPEPFDEQSTG